MTDPSLISRLNDLLAHARRDVPLYARLHANTGEVADLDAFARIPTVSSAAYAAAPLIETLAAGEDLCASRTDVDDPADGHAPRLLSYDDVLDEYHTLDFFLDFAEVIETPQRVLIMADPSWRYTMADFGKLIAFYGWPMAALASCTLTEREAVFAARFAPTMLFQRSEGDVPWLPDSVAWQFRFETAPHRMAANGEHALGILCDPVAGMLAIRRLAESVYSYDEELFYFEVGDDDRLIVSSFIHRLQPLLRIVLPLKAKLLDGGRFIVDA